MLPLTGRGPTNCGRQGAIWEESVRAGGAEEVATDDMDIVSALRAAVVDKVGKERFELWFGANTRLEIADGTLTIDAPSQFLANFLRLNFRRHVEAACLDVLGELPAVEFRASAASGEPSVAAATARPAGSTSPPTAPVGSPRGQPAADPGAAGRRNGSPRRPFADLESFVTGPSNRLAHASAEKVVRRLGELSPLLIFGPTSVGKTHLLEGIWTAVRRGRRGTAAVYLSAEQFASGFLEALRGSGLPSFRRKYRGVDLLIIDDLQFLCGKRATQIELLYTIDTLMREGRQLVFAGDRRPEELSDLGPELATRLQSGLVCRIEPPDYDTRLGIVAQMARRFRLNLPDEVARLIASRLTQHARQLSGALCRLQAAGQAWGKPITLAMAEETLADMIHAASPVVRLPDIEKAVCKTFGLEPKTLQSGRRAKRISHPRMLAMWLARKYTRSALTEIGHYFGRRSHSTVISAQKRVDRWLSAGSSVELADRTWNVDEAIRQVEEQLRAG